MKPACPVGVELVEKRPPAGMRMLVQARLRMRLLLRVAAQEVVPLMLEQRRKAGLVPLVRSTKLEHGTEKSRVSSMLTKKKNHRKSQKRDTAPE